MLDIGCGPGWFWGSTVHLLPPELRLSLADLSRGMAEGALGRCHGLPLAAVEGRTADAVALPFEDGSFDAVIAMHMHYHV